MTRIYKSIRVLGLSNGSIKISWKHPRNNISQGLLQMGLFMLLLWGSYAIFPIIKVGIIAPLFSYITSFPQTNSNRISHLLSLVYGISILLLFLWWYSY